MQACGGLMTAEKAAMPNMPRLDTEKEPPWNSSGFSLPSRARPARSFTACPMDATPRRSAAVTMGVMSPLGVATATEMSTLPSPLCTDPAAAFQRALARGTSRSASAALLMTRSLTDTATSSCFFSCWRKSNSESISHSIVRYRCGTVALDSARRLAMILRMLELGMSVNRSLTGPAGVGDSEGAGEDGVDTAANTATTVGAAEGAEVAACLSDPLLRASTTSLLLMRPCLAVPTILDEASLTDKPADWIICLAAGEKRACLLLLFCGIVDSLAEVGGATTEGDGEVE
mmetsp:Transcript_16847/g.23187  ORF Transcript_16847/g.23187 Transcript_16847/m.23187 type:complete len:288 (+) Transcript_16847:2681-3544(+)